MKKSYGKVKRYGFAFNRGPGFWLKKILALLLAGALLFLLGWVIGPAVINAGTSTWYALKNAGGGDPVSEPTATPAPTAEPDPTATPEPTPIPVDEDGAWAWVTLSSVRTPEQAAATAQSLVQQGARYVVLTLKDSQGYIYYNSALPAAARSIAASTVDAAAVAQTMKDAGLVPVAALCAFQDPTSPYTDRSMGIHYENTEMFWLDAAAEAGGKPWLNPYAEPAIDFIEALVAETMDLGFEQVALSGVQFPDRATARCGYGDTAGISQNEQLRRDLAAFAAVAEEKGGTLWLTLPLETAAQESPAVLGGPLSGLQAERILVELPAEQTEETAALLEAVRGAVGDAALLVRNGDWAEIDR
ncbi:MAG: hypothetical protein IJ484_09055 [Oscillospiraceae bacterium]|nr:hypothetical protein [Oscillospiraceae bacterium]